jgi:hypothetical protein
MAYINIFISHSSADKELVRAVVEILGNNGITVDEYVFESGERTEDEINISNYINEYILTRYKSVS